MPAIRGHRHLFWVWDRSTLAAVRPPWAHLGLYALPAGDPGHRQDAGMGWVMGHLASSPQPGERWQREAWPRGWSVSMDCESPDGALPRTRGVGQRRQAPWAQACLIRVPWGPASKEGLPLSAWWHLIGFGGGGVGAALRAPHSLTLGGEKPAETRQGMCP